MIIRSANENDKASVRLIRERALPEDPTWYENNIGLTETLNLVAEENSVVVGFVTVLLTRWDLQGDALWKRLAPYIGAIGVLPEQQRIGIGRKLLACAMREIAVRCPNERFVYLEHHSGRDYLRRFYQGHGFRTMSAEETFRTAGLCPRASVMCCDL